VKNLTDDFKEEIEGTYLENNYKDYLIVGGRYSYIYQERKSELRSNYAFFRWNVELAGNLLHGIDNMLDSRDTVEGGYYAIKGLQYAQFAKTDIDWRYYQGFGNRNSLVYRAFGGVALPYGNANAVPFIRQYYSGGAEGMRAWQVKELGPGSFQQPDSVYPNQMSDIKLEFNIEHRYDIFGNFKGATFIDIGNIWAISEEDERPGAVFQFDQFYKQFAIGTGLGIRYDIRFAVIRLDAGIKVRVPSREGNDSWILFNRPFNYRHINWNFAIGYPF
jgi:outer membrane protein assembly factor BamA